jgi:NAD(P)-dependent dehydrogenase (short-subunit alcohol dehydrogenase family)
MPNALITGTSAGLGRALAAHLLGQGWSVYGLSRRGSDLPGIRHSGCDLTDADLVRAALDGLLADSERLDLVVLNAGVVGEIGLLAETPLADAKAVMDVNLWANKSVMDWLYAWGRPVDQVVMISSGASVLGNKGWGGYALSKAALNMLAKLYSHEFAQTHITALAPGIIDTAMMDYLCGEADAEAFPALQRLRDARGSERMPEPATAAARVVAVLPRLRGWASGSFVDIREILDPDAYAGLYQGR